MKLLLDTHTALWLVNEYEKLSSTAQEMLLDDNNMLYISISSVWEIAIKVSLGRLYMLCGGVGEFLSKLDEMPITIVPIEPQYMKTIESLSFIHRDPFDRMIVATAINENMTILTADENIPKYDIQSIW
jgi:PIN domain nuclease of toxin-antitoxin system